MARAKATIRVLALRRLRMEFGGRVRAAGATACSRAPRRSLGFATDVAPPADFVIQSRPQSDHDFIPIFQPPPEPAKPVMSDKELKAVKGDLDSVEKAHDAIRSAFPPAAKALAEQKAAEAKKAQAKPPAANQ